MSAELLDRLRSGNPSSEDGHDAATLIEHLQQNSVLRMHYDALVDECTQLRAELHAIVRKS